MRRISLVGALLLFGCSATDPMQQYTVTFPGLTVDSGVEKTQCVVLNLHNPSPIHVGQFHNVLSEASHHMIVYRVTDTVEQPTPFDCEPFVDTLNPAKGAPLMITQKKDDLLTLPAGVAYTLEANQMLRLEMHYINASTGPLQLSGSSTIVSAPTFQQEASFLFIGDPDITLAPQSQFTLGPIYFGIDPTTFANAKFFAFTGHEHRFGTNVTIQEAASAGDLSGQMIYDVPNWVWSDPATVVADPPIELPAGGGFNFTCTWDNTSAQTIKFGESATDEMCFFWTYYYPSQGAFVCFHTTQAGGHDFCCPGAGECAFLAQGLNGMKALNNGF